MAHLSLENPTELAPLICAAFLMVSISTAGVCQVLWLRTGLSQRLQQPVDLGMRLRGRPLFGQNKTLRGFVVMVPATGLAFLAWSMVPLFAAGIWELTPIAFLLLGMAAGLGFMLGELPNSMLKRQLDIAPGEAPDKAWLRWLCLLLDRTDSILGALLVVSLLVPVSAWVWLNCLLVGPGIHAFFSFMLYLLRVKKRAA